MGCHPSKVCDVICMEPPPLIKDGKISGTAEKTINTIMREFEMNSTKHILAFGNPLGMKFDLLEYGEKVRNELKHNIGIWDHGQTEEVRERFRNLDGLLNAVQTKDVTEIAKIYYQSQHLHTLAHYGSQLEVAIFIDENVNGNWGPNISNAINSINTAAPGLNLYVCSTVIGCKIRIIDNYESGAWTQPRMRPIRIHLPNSWPNDKMQGTSLHELLHALGFMHEMQRSDANLYLKFNLQNEENADQYRRLFPAVTRFDPFSVSMYNENDSMTRTGNDAIWKLKPGKDRSEELSELDKVALNILYKPCRSDRYNPKISEQTGMLYCGRTVMDKHNQCAPGTTDGQCGPANWANCPACRVIKEIDYKKITKLHEYLNRGLWQGLSGLFYCGKTYSDTILQEEGNVLVEHDGVCGINNGVPCTKCGKALFPDYDLKMFIRMRTL